MAPAPTNDACTAFQLVDLTLMPTFCSTDSTACVPLHGFQSRGNARSDCCLVSPASCRPSYCPTFGLPDALHAVQPVPASIVS